MTEVDVVVVGAGVAGLAAAAALRAAGRRCLVLEAAGRIGGRAWTTHPAVLGGHPFDHGASWLHAAERNPLRALAEQAGIALFDAEPGRQTRLFLPDGPADATAGAGYDAAYAKLNALALARAQEAPDISLADAVAAQAAEPWTATFLAWEGAIIAAAEAHRLSLRDWAANLLAGGNFSVPDGLGALVVHVLGPAAPLRLNAAVTRIDWGGPAGVVVEGPAGRVAARSCIVTVSTGVLAAGTIRFTPALPAETEAAIAALPMGLLTKIALPAAGADRLDLPAFTTVERQVAAGEPALVFNAWPFGRPMLVGFVGGDAAWDLARAGPAAAEDFARTRLRALFGGRAARAIGPGALVTGWGEDDLTRGAYCYARPSQSDARAALAQPLAGGRLVFAGEACHVGLAGTVAGAYLAGQRAAAAAA